MFTRYRDQPPHMYESENQKIKKQKSESESSPMFIRYRDQPLICMKLNIWKVKKKKWYM